jgi:Protein of unknown function (DUF3617)
MKTLLCCLPLVAFSLAATAQDMPKRKPGLWEMKMESAQMPGGAMTMLQCVDANTDAELQKNAMQNNQSGQTQCQPASIKKLSNGYDSTVICKTAQGTSTMRAISTGDFNSNYQIDMTMRMDPPTKGMAEMKSLTKVRHMGVCTGGMKPGDISVNGMVISGLGKPGGAPAGGGKMSQEDMQKMMEQMKKQMGK